MSAESVAAGDELSAAFELHIDRLVADGADREAMRSALGNYMAAVNNAATSGALSWIHMLQSQIDQLKAELQELKARL